MLMKLHRFTKFGTVNRAMRLPFYLEKKNRTSLTVRDVFQKKIKQNVDVLALIHINIHSKCKSEMLFMESISNPKKRNLRLT